MAMPRRLYPRSYRQCISTFQLQITLKHSAQQKVITEPLVSHYKTRNVLSTATSFVTESASSSAATSYAKGKCTMKSSQLYTQKCHLYCKQLCYQVLKCFQHWVIKASYHQSIIFGEKFTDWTWNSSSSTLQSTRGLCRGISTRFGWVSPKLRIMIFISVLIVSI